MSKSRKKPEWVDPNLLKMDHPTHFVNSLKEVKTLIGYCKQTGYCSFDFETTGTEFYNPQQYILMVGISFQPGSSWIVPLGHEESFCKDSWEEVLTLLSKELFQNPDLVKICWNLKFEHKWLMRYGLNMYGRCFDGMLAKYVLNEERPHDLKSMVAHFYSEYANYELSVRGRPWKEIPLNELGYYCGIDCDMTFRLMVHFEKNLLSQSKLYRVFRSLLMPASVVLAESEFLGIPIDVPYLDGLMESYKHKIEDLDQKLRNNKKLKRFEKARQKRHFRDLIKSVQTEIAEIEDSDKPNKERLIKARVDKINRYINGELITKKEIYQPFNFNSPKQMIELLFTHSRGFNFEVVKYTTDKNTKRDTNTPSTDESVLEELKSRDKSGFMDLLLEYRGQTKLYSTYVVGMRGRVSDRGRVHGTFHLQGTVTGRLSSRDPNLQNIPRGTTASDIKTMFLPDERDSEYVLLEVDYSQAELRVVAEEANEDTMIEWFKTGLNIHLAVALKMNHAEDQRDKVKMILKDPNHQDNLYWEKQKKKAKTVNFGILYGQTEKKLSAGLTEATGEYVSPEEAKQFLDDWFDLFPKIRKYIKSRHKRAKERGYVENMFGRKRRLPNIYSDNFGIMLEAQRQSVNAPIQGTASDFTLFSTVVILQHIREGKLPQDMKQLYTVHDSIGFRIHPKDLMFAVPRIKEICNNPQTLEYFNFQLNKVRMEVSPEVGINWGALEEYNPYKNYSKPK